MSVETRQYTKTIVSPEDAQVAALKERRIQERVAELHKLYPDSTIFRTGDTLRAPNLDQDPNKPVTSVIAVEPFAATPRDGINALEVRDKSFITDSVLKVAHLEVGRITGKGNERLERMDWAYIPGTNIEMNNTAPPVFPSTITE